MRAPGGRPPLTAEQRRTILKTIPKALPASEEHDLPRGMVPERVLSALDAARADPRMPKQILREIRRDLLVDAQKYRTASQKVSDIYPEERRRLEQQAAEFEMLAQSRVSQKELQQFVILRAWQAGFGSMTYNNQARTGAVIEFFRVTFPIMYGGKPLARSTATRAVIKYKRLHFNRLGGSGALRIDDQHVTIIRAGDQEPDSLK